MGKYLTTRIIWIACTIGLWAAEGYSQIQLAFTPKITLSTPVAPQWSIVTNLESRQAFYEDNLEYDYILTDVKATLAYKTLKGYSYAGGVQLRYREAEWFYRIAQQVSMVRPMDGYRLGHRFAADQTFGPSDNIYRFRYRISMDKPLSGDRVDVGEWYIKLGNEYLYAIQEIDDIEARILSFLGYQLLNNKIEVGLEYRIDRWLVDGVRQRLFFEISWYGNL